MTEGMFLIANGQLSAMAPADYQSEDELQSFIARHPDLLPGALIDPANPRRWMLLKREAGLAVEEGGSDHFSVDHLLVDQDAIPTIVEVKRSTNTQIRREIVGQMFDYAANAVHHWPTERLQQWAASEHGDHAGVAVKIGELLGFDGAARDDAVRQFWHDVEKNLQEGRLRLLFVADSIPPMLVRIIEFLNDQMTRTEVLGIAISRHKADNADVLSPAVVGKTTAADIAKGKDPVTLTQLEEDASPETREVLGRLEALSATYGWHIRPAAKSRIVHADGIGSLFTWYPRDGTLESYVWQMADHGMPEESAELVDILEEIRGSRPGSRHPHLRCASVLTHWTRFEAEWLPRYVDARRRAAALQTDS